jgi:type II secretory pathway pseudopilin PulG
LTESFFYKKDVIMRGFSKSSFTLLELLVTSVLVGIVIVGAVAVDYAIRKSRQSADRASVTRGAVQQAMLRMHRDAAKVVGDESAKDTATPWTSRGIFANAIGPFRTICFREDVSGTPGIFSDDNWNCYEHRSTDNHISRCVRTNAEVLIEFVPGFVACDIQPQFERIIRASDPNFFTLPLDAQNHIEYVELRVQTHYNCHINGNTCSVLSNNPIENPQFTLTTRISPQGLSR